MRKGSAVWEALVENCEFKRVCELKSLCLFATVAEHLLRWLCLWKHPCSIAGRMTHPCSIAGRTDQKILASPTVTLLSLLRIRGI